ncbi:hypothetical protein K3172_12860 [Qipengyuania sp. 6B39]|uniref:hypothetical protein n=1 Tax=Qipengyuania proteolytica TaxID=2867239 RepID=UPI001C89C973|nr:hypothetical protein [Qipengyuania proteolytica]MBX7496749.1 hypothetical protein [Qipengyuania proteolytica]
MILLAFGWLLIGCAFIFAGWLAQAFEQGGERSLFNAGFVMAVCMDLHSLGFMLTFGGRIQQMLFDGATFATVSPVYWFGTGLIFLAKTGFVWLAALGEGRDWSKLFVFSYFFCLLAWAAFVMWWYV